MREASSYPNTAFVTLLALLLAAALSAPPAQAARPTPFSAGPVGGTAPPGWTLQDATPKTKRQTRYDLVRDGKTIVLRARADGSSAMLKHGLYANPANTPVLHWRWRTDRMLQGADLTRKERDDHAARLCVLFDRDPEQLGLKERALLKLERAKHGERYPAATLCYVWDNRLPVDSMHDAQSSKFAVIVVAASGAGAPGRWLSMQRDTAEDYRRAFNAEPPSIVGVTVSVDTADTGESVVTHFGDIDFWPKRAR